MRKQYNNIIIYCSLMLYPLFYGIKWFFFSHFSVIFINFPYFHLTHHCLSQASVALVVLIPPDMLRTTMAIQIPVFMSWIRSGIGASGDSGMALLLLPQRHCCSSSYLVPPWALSFDTSSSFPKFVEADPHSVWLLLYSPSYIIFSSSLRLYPSSLSFSLSPLFSSSFSYSFLLIVWNIQHCHRRAIIYLVAIFFILAFCASCFIHWNGRQFLTEIALTDGATIFLAMDVQPISLLYQIVDERDVLHGSQYWLRELTYVCLGTFSYVTLQTGEKKFHCIEHWLCSLIFLLAVILWGTLVHLRLKEIFSPPVMVHIVHTHFNNTDT